MDVETKRAEGQIELVGLVEDVNREFYKKDVELAEETAALKRKINRQFAGDTVMLLGSLFGEISQNSGPK